jgi:hypothetical protein
MLHFQNSVIGPILFFYPSFTLCLTILNTQKWMFRNCIIQNSVSITHLTWNIHWFPLSTPWTSILHLLQISCVVLVDAELAEKNLRDQYGSLHFWQQQIISSIFSSIFIMIASCRGKPCGCVIWNPCSTGTTCPLFNTWAWHRVLAQNFRTS